MRVSILASTVVVAAALFVAGCGGGPKDPSKSLSAACERQIEQINEETHESSTPTAKSTEERVNAVTLKHCSGQDVVLASPDQLKSASDESDDANAEESTGDDEAPATDESAKDEEPAKEEPAKLDPAARDLFSEKCASCHALADADATGAVGPNLDDTDLDADAIESQIVNGGGAMPPGLLQGDDATSVAEYVAAAAGK